MESSLNVLFMFLKTNMEFLAKYKHSVLELRLCSTDINCKHLYIHPSIHPPGQEHPTDSTAESTTKLE